VPECGKLERNARRPGGGGAHFIPQHCTVYTVLPEEGKGDEV
jgi:hypothetical protein